MVEQALQFSPFMQICLLLLTALCAAVSWRQASAATRHKKHLSVVQMDLLTLESELSRLRELVQRLSKRQSLADYKANVAADDEPRGEIVHRDQPPGANATKEQLRQYWLKGRTHQEIALLAKGQR